MSDSERIQVLEKELRRIKTRLNKEKKSNPEYKKKEQSEYNKFVKEYCATEKLNLKDGEVYDHKKLFAKAAEEWASLKNKTN